MKFQFGIEYESWRFHHFRVFVKVFGHSLITATVFVVLAVSRDVAQYSNATVNFTVAGVRSNLRVHNLSSRKPVWCERQSCK